MKYKLLKMSSLGCAFFALPFLISCTQNQKVDSANDRFPAQSNAYPVLADDKPQIVYVTYGKDGVAKPDIISVDKWEAKDKDLDTGARRRNDYLLKMFYASTVGLSSRNILHSVCFTGLAQDIERLFFDKSIRKVRNVYTNKLEDQNGLKIQSVQGVPETKTSSDGRMIGIKFLHQQTGDSFFRMANCSSGKSTVSDIAKPASDVPVGGSRSAAPGAAASPPTAKGGSRDPFFGFTIFHKVKDLNKKKYPEFVVRADYNASPIPDEEKPWKGMDLKDPKQSLIFTLIVQKYFYENMANQNPTNPDFNFIADKNRKRFWCHMPWMNVGTAGREALHGLTQERDLIPSTQLPPYFKSTPGTNWGVAYFNSSACRGLQDVFGTGTNPKPIPDFSRDNYFSDGSLITKMLFTTAQFPEIADAYTWNAHVNEVGSTERAIKPVRHIQMDIAVKDASLVGTNPLLKNWAMAGFYYDPTYDYDKEYKEYLGGMENPISSIPNLPKQLLKMRPMGVQTGFDAPDSIVFKGAATNGLKGRLNGPADNPKTSCLGCHAAAGTSAKMVPGFLSMKMYEPFIATKALDFSQQLALAKANFETAIP